MDYTFVNVQYGVSEFSAPVADYF
jgi:hypothetical protein